MEICPQENALGSVPFGLPEHTIVVLHTEVDTGLRWHRKTLDDVVFPELAVSYSHLEAGVFLTKAPGHMGLKY